MRVPGGLAVVVRVRVDEAGRHEQAVGVDRVPGPAVGAADVDDHAVAHAHVGGAGGGPGAVDDRPTPDHEVVHRNRTLQLLVSPCSVERNERASGPAV